MKDWTTTYIEKKPKNKQIERDEVLKPCLNLCKTLLIQDVILQYRRLNALDYSHIKGSPDIEIMIPCKGMLWVVMCECKKPGGKLHESQIKYKERFKNLINVLYVEVKSKEELKEIINRFIK